MSKQIPGKSVWPELVGKPAWPAALTISHERGDVYVEVFPQGSQVDPDYNPQRVCVFFDKKHLVSEVPVIG